MKARGARITESSGPYCRALLQSGFDLQFMARNAIPPVVAEGEVFPTECLLLCTPLRKPATRLSSPCESSVHATTSLEMLLREAEAGGTAMRNAYAEKAAETAWKMLIRRKPHVLLRPFVPSE